MRTPGTIALVIFILVLLPAIAASGLVVYDGVLRSQGMVKYNYYSLGDVRAAVPELVDRDAIFESGGMRLVKP